MFGMDSDAELIAFAKRVLEEARRNLDAQDVIHIHTAVFLADTPMGPVEFRHEVDTRLAKGDSLQLKWEYKGVTGHVMRGI